MLKNQYLPNNVQSEYAKNNHSMFLFQVFVETLDKCFENVCELDLIFHVDKVKLRGKRERERDRQRERERDRERI